MTSGDAFTDRRKVIDRAELSQALSDLGEDYAPDSPAMRTAVLQLLKDALSAGHDEVQRRFDASGSGNLVVTANCYLMDQLIRALYDFTTGVVFNAANPTDSERIGLVAIGGYGRGELAPQSDIDLLFLLPYKQTPWGEQVIEYMLYMLWDLRLKVGHATRTVNECIRLSLSDLTIRTTLLEGRYLWGDEDLFKEMKVRFNEEVVADTGPDFVEAKLAERNERHQRMGDSRYLLEPNVKDGKGGLRDLHTLFWIAKYLYQVDDVAELVGRGVLTEAEYRLFTKAETFLRKVRCQLHYLAKRPEERLTFDVQPELAARLGYTDHTGSSGVERFMKHYFLVAKDVGDLTRIFCAALEEQHKRQPRFRLPRFGLRRREIDGFLVEGDRINLLDDDDFRRDPLKLIRLFHVAHEKELDIHPQALRLITRNLRLIDNDLRDNAEANRLFLEIISSTRNPETTLRRMNEAGVFGRFVPDFGRVVAQMQHDMYHVYTVDEHTIRAMGILARIEAGELEDDHPLSSEVIGKVKLRRVLYVALLLHDIAKGRGGDHSVLGAEVAEALCPRLGMDAAETETVAWLVRWHLGMAHTAFKRDLDDPKSISDFVELVQSPERLKLLVVLTVCDIRAVGPGIWNGWKGQLLRLLYNRAEEYMLGGQPLANREERAEGVREALREKLQDWPEAAVERHLARGVAAFWLSAELSDHEYWARIMRAADEADQGIAIDVRVHPFESFTELAVYTADHPGLFSRLAGAISVSGATIAGARIFTTTDGMALDVFSIQDMDGNPIERPESIARLRRVIGKILSGEQHLSVALGERRSHLPGRASVFTVQPAVIIDNEASRAHTVIEVNGRDRPALLHDLTKAFYSLSLTIANARIATYGERAVDVFYVKDLFGLKITAPTRLETIRLRLLDALADPDQPTEETEQPDKAVTA
ncbi:MAG: [protein-PII] uridylyltransferase [Rhodospirillaceae bacterium]|nr:[protein-PII] uridylyltransferase [Rhodospirillaceae bacterium]MBT5526771.1 [protein-PII] uridylyltransferase [Rhodospirillaceae bacterium]MBT5879136.1 [protein-PII] uridylyltransferase [Rhodospirillaceae bacterium]MBT6588289.1 [protein-PII] uridylyltransferase [Rhodospirillaceae bacterium]MBT7663552.1 [protein-PII] uridylyltransferase [Rhodospirillaceae bacterium]